MSGRRRRRSSQPSPSSPAPDAGEQEEVGVDLTRVLSAVESLTAQVRWSAKCIREGGVLMCEASWVGGKFVPWSGGLVPAQGRPAGGSGGSQRQWCGLRTPRVEQAMLMCEHHYKLVYNTTSAPLYLAASLSGAAVCSPWPAGHTVLKFLRAQRPLEGESLCSTVRMGAVVT